MIDIGLSKWIDLEYMFDDNWESVRWVVPDGLIDLLNNKMKEEESGLFRESVGMNDGGPEYIQELCMSG